ncbi:MAG: hypothetical protein Q6353_003925 [Candidatus Sigynarchaeum springense]
MHLLEVAGFAGFRVVSVIEIWFWVPRFASGERTEASREVD